MSRFVWVDAFKTVMGREPTQSEKDAFLAALAVHAGGEYVYIPKLPQSQVDPCEVLRLRIEGMSIRKIARKVGISKSQVSRFLKQGELSQLSPYGVDAEAA